MVNRLKTARGHITGIVAIGQVTNEMATGLSIPVTAGTRLILVYSASVTAGAALGFSSFLGGGAGASS